MSTKKKKPAKRNDTRVSKPKLKKKEGRPEIKPDVEQLRQLCAIQCTQAEIATVLGISRRTVERWAQREELKDIFAFGRELGRVSVRRKQFELMNAGSVAMSIWLGKQLLGQKEEVKVENTGDSITYAGLLGIIDRIESQRETTPE